MAVIDQVRQLKSQGMGDSEIIGILQEQGISPREINDALTRSKIKEAVYTNSFDDESEQGMQEGMEPSVLSEYQEAPLEPLPQEGPYAQEIGYGGNLNAPIPGQADYSHSSEKYPQEFQGYGYPDENISQYPAQSQGYSSQDMISEIADQMISEKTKDILKKISELSEIKTLLSSKVDKIDQRLTRIESIIDQLQASLLRNSTQQEQTLSDIKTEMEMMQESFSKVLNPLIDIEREIERPKVKSKTYKKHTKK
ncbi:MAG: hypothetical protein QW727_00745 [Candidatus Pacearchaeota archaeon]